MRWKLFFLNSHHPDAFYVVPHHIPDPFFCLIDTETRHHYVYLDKREFGIIEALHLPGVTLRPLEPVNNVAMQKDPAVFLWNRRALAILEEQGLAEIAVHIHAPVDMVDFLRSQGVKAEPLSPFFPERRTKSDAEVAHIKKVYASVYDGYRLVEDLLARATVGDDRTLSCEGEILTSELLKRRVSMLFFERGITCPEGIIISAGAHAAIPHHRGEGPLKSGETIICDFYPRSEETRYFADITRTYVKGAPTKKQQAMYDAVALVQEELLAKIAPGATGDELTRAALTRFEELGFPTGEEGFVHGVGHSFGLEIHEFPYASLGFFDPLTAGNILTVEPGLYYKAHGGVRIEDVVRVTEHGCEPVSSYPKRFVIP